MLKPRSASNVSPAEELEREIARNAVFVLRFRRTDLDASAEAIAQVAIRNQTLLVRVVAKNLPLPERWKEQRYSLWVDIPNYSQKMYIGDLPIIRLGKTEEGDFYKTAHNDATGSGKVIRRGDSDTTFRFTALPRNAVFGGLILTAEPARYEPIVNEPLRPLLIAHTTDRETENIELPPLLAKSASPETTRSKRGEVVIPQDQRGEGLPTLKVRPEESVTQQERAPSAKANAQQIFRDEQVVYVGSMLDKVAKRVAPVYPQAARSSGVTGLVTVYLETDASGTVTRVQHTSGPPELRQAAVDAARQWKFKPTIVNGQAVRMTGFVIFNFQL